LAFVVVDHKAQFKQYLQEHDRSEATVRAYSIGVATFEAWLVELTG
jgi:hypothetical protein